MNRVITFSAAIAALFAYFAWLNGPALSIDVPANAATLCEPIPVQLSWRGLLDPATLRVELVRGNRTTK